MKTYLVFVMALFLSLSGVSKEKVVDKQDAVEVTITGVLTKINVNVSANREVELWKVDGVYLANMSEEYKKLINQKVSVTGTVEIVTCYSCGGEGNHYHKRAQKDKVMTISTLKKIE